MPARRNGLSDVTISAVTSDIFRVEIGAAPPGSGSVNAWVLYDRPGEYSVVDAGFPGAEQSALWRNAILPRFVGKPWRVICTHHHPDHVGQMGLLCGELGAALWLSERAWKALRPLGEPPSREGIARDLGYLRRCGLDEEAIGVYGARLSQRSPLPLPTSPRFIACGETVEVGDRLWTATVANGHACGSLILVDKDGELAVVGDEILPNTTPHVGTVGMGPADDPLADYLDLLAWAKTLPRSTLVLPGHGAAYVDPAHRAQDIHAHHQCELERVRGMIATPKSCAELALELFGSRHQGIHRVLAVTETHAHLNYLRIHEGSVRSRIQDGIEVFSET